MFSGREAARYKVGPMLKCAAIAVAFVAYGHSAHAAVITPSQMVSAYNLSGVTFGSSGVTANGAGQTIAIIDWDNDPNIQTEVSTFNSTFGLQTFNSGGPTLTVVGETGGTVPSNPTTSVETALDVQWAHVMAPQANILLVEAESATFVDTNQAVTYAKGVAGVSVISMSYGAPDTSGANYSQYESTFTQAGTSQGVSFVASTGDTSTPSYPSTSAHVIALGGSSLSITNGVRTNETVWFTNTNSAEGTGYSQWDTRPTFQNGANSNAKRGVPDLVMDADPNTGVDVFFGTTSTSTEYTGVGGTSLSAPLFAGLLADSNQGRVLNGLPTLNSDQALTMIYALLGTPLYSSCFYDVTSGASHNQTAGVGFDTASGMGAPIASGLLEYLAGYTSVPEPSSFCICLLPMAMLARRRRTRAVNRLI